MEPELISSLCDLLIDGEYYEDAEAKLFQDAVIILIKVPPQAIKKNKVETILRVGFSFDLIF